MMQEDDLKIGLAFSGGGFRASAFSLGVLSYLNAVKIGESTLLEKVIVLSTVSGGSIAGARYTIGIKNGETFDSIYESIYRFMSDVDIIKLSLDILSTDKKKESLKANSLICAFADVYDAELFNKANFGILLTDAPQIHLKHFSFNATDFSYALQFRFQWTEKINNPQSGEPSRGIIGNHYYRIPESVAKDIRMADILASSSCFPGGFEPINFPNDFGLTIPDEIKHTFKDVPMPVGLMDGGIVDNQGIEPLLLAEKRLKRNCHNNTDYDSNVLDLLIISDVTSPYMDDYKANNQEKRSSWRQLSPKTIIFINSIVLIASIVGLFLSINHTAIYWSVFFTVSLTLNLLLFALITIINAIPQKLKIPKIFTKPLAKLLKIKIYVYEDLISNRYHSLMKMTNDVFLKHVRRLNYSKIYDDKSWKNRRIMNAIYELRHNECRLDAKIKKGKIRKELIPTKEIQNIASLAASMKTTLWFTDEDKANNMLDSIIACGQFTMCWNLLEYIETIKRNTKNTNESHKALNNCEEQIMEHWEKFKVNPFWMVNEYKNK